MQSELTIDRDALRHNVQLLRAHSSPAKFSAVVKANAYGHGLAEIVPAIMDLVDAFCVYETAEATMLRSLGAKQPIMVVGPVPPSEFRALLEADAIAPLWDRGTWLHELASTAERMRTRARLHLKIDSGLSRLGLTESQVKPVVREAQSLPSISLEGAYSHLSAAEELDSRYTFEQLGQFERLVPSGMVTTRHIAASAAAMLWQSTRLDLVRTGIACYGVWPSEGSKSRLAETLPLRPVLGWTSKLVAVRDIAAETPIGYGATYRPACDARIGIIPIGYAEGLPRSLSNRGRVLVDGILCPIVGRICMNVAMVDVSAVPTAHVGSRVTFIGTDRKATITAEGLSADAETIAYELVARIPASTPRRLVTSADMPSTAAGSEIKREIGV